MVPLLKPGCAGGSEPQTLPSKPLVALIRDVQEVDRLGNVVLGLRGAR